MVHGLIIINRDFYLYFNNFLIFNPIHFTEIFINSFVSQHKQQATCNNNNFIDNFNQLNMFRATFSPILRSVRLIIVASSWLFISLYQILLYGCEIWSLTRREEVRLRVFENRVLRRIFGPKRDEVTGELRKLHNEGLNYLYSSPNIVRVIKSRRMRWAGHVARRG